MSATSPANGTPHDHDPITPPPPGPDAKPQAADGGRDAHGRFARGNAGGPGNPFARQVAALRSALLASVTGQDLEDVARALVRQAKEGNVAAAKLLLSYALGRPVPAVDPDTLDLHEWGLYQRLPDPSAELAAAPQRLGLPVALAYMRGALPKIAEAQAGLMRDGLKDMEARDRAAAEARARRAERRQEKAAPKAPVPPADEEALALLGRLLDLAPPSANGGFARPGCLTPPSTNGRCRPDGAGEGGRR
jgi:hypothetical protein